MERLQTENEAILLTIKAPLSPEAANIGKKDLLSYHVRNFQRNTSHYISCETSVLLNNWELVALYRMGLPDEQGVRVKRGLRAAP